jgi:hypothetical protein
MSFHSFNNDSENNYDELLEKLTSSLYLWHDEISSEIDQSAYIKDIDELLIDVEVYKDFILSILIYQEMICESSGISYVQEIQAKYSLLDIFKIINSLINKNNLMSKKDLIIFSVLLFKNLKTGMKFKINLNQITNKIHPVISMIFYNELNKKIKDLGLKDVKNLSKKNFKIEDLAQIVQRKIKEGFVFNK